MNKLYSLLIVCLLALPVTSMAKSRQDSVAVNNTTLGIHPWKQTRNLSDKFAHWSLTFEAGFNLIDADFTQPHVTIIPKTKIRPTGAVSLEYNFTPTWGLAGVYSYANYGVKQKETADWLLYGHMHTVDILLTYDLVDAWFPHRKTDIFSCYFLAGVGMAFYNSKLTAGEETLWPRTDGKYDMAGAIAVGLAFEFNVSRQIALGAKGLYHIYTQDNLDAKIQGNNNDCQEYVSAYLRWKIGGGKKNHQRNFASDEVFASQLQESEQELRKPQKDTVVIMHKDTVVVNNENVIQYVPEVKIPDRRQYVYFATDRYSLDNLALITVQQFAAQMQEDSSLCVELAGYCDNTGSEQHNLQLAQRRANRVAEELEKVYGIASERIAPIGRGMLTNVDNSYLPNRRVEMRIISKEKCKQLQQEKAKVEESAAPVAVKPAAKPAILTTVNTQKNVTTLSRLARKYFGNTDCWVYIYAANRDKLRNPDYIPENITLNIPNLSGEQKNISHKEAIRFVQELAKVSVEE